jgi:hypothetical protein
MDKKLFADLVESMQQHNEIIAGTRKPVKATKVDAQSIKVLRAKAGLTQENLRPLYRLIYQRCEIVNKDGVNRPGRRTR